MLALAQRLGYKVESRIDAAHHFGNQVDFRVPDDLPGVLGEAIRIGQVGEVPQIRDAVQAHGLTAAGLHAPGVIHQQGRYPLPHHAVA